jgi:hypothetical protein
MSFHNARKRITPVGISSTRTRGLQPPPRRQPAHHAQLLQTLAARHGPTAAPPSNAASNPSAATGSQIRTSAKTARVKFVFGAPLSYSNPPPASRSRNERCARKVALDHTH